MMHEFCTSRTNTIVLGDFFEDSGKATERALDKIKKLILAGSILPEKEEGPFLLKKYEYDYKKNCYIIGPELIELDISKENGEVSVSIKAT